MPDSSRDISQKYHNSFIFYDGELRHVTGVQAIDPERTSVGLSDGNSITSVVWEEDKCKEIMPNSKFFNPYPLDKRIAPSRSARLFYRHPRRQWTRSINDAICTQTVVAKELYDLHGLMWPTRPDYNLNHETVKALLSEDYPTINAALVFLGKAIAIAISPFYCLTLSTIGQKPLVLSQYGWIGQVDEDVKTIIIRHAVAVQEFRDYINRSNQSTEWRVVHAA